MRKNISLILSILALTAVMTLLLDYQIKPPVKTLDEISNSVDLPLYTAPDFSINDVKSRELKLSDFKGKIIILHFWASWCPPCVQEFPKLISISEELKGHVILLALSSDESKLAIKNFIRKTVPSADKQNNVYMIWDEKRKITHDLYQSFAYPETIIIDAQGKMIRKIAGDADWTSPEMKSYLQSLIDPLADKPTKP